MKYALVDVCTRDELFPLNDDCIALVEKQQLEEELAVAT
jgi:hypothetical protein